MSVAVTRADASTLAAVSRAAEIRASLEDTAGSVSTASTGTLPLLVRSSPCSG
jgi:hypothetical protein